MQLNAAAQEHWGVGHAYQHKIRLITGKTHQIRAQLAAVAAPLLGDHLYATLLANGVFRQVPMSGSHSPDRQRADQGKPGTLAGGSAASADSVDDAGQDGVQDTGEWIGEYREGASYERPLGLQAYELRVDQTSCMGEPPVTFTAGVPWWL